MIVSAGWRSVFEAFRDFVLLIDEFAVTWL